MKIRLELVNLLILSAILFLPIQSSFKYNLNLNFFSTPSNLPLLISVIIFAGSLLTGFKKISIDKVLYLSSIIFIYLISIFLTENLKIQSEVQVMALLLIFLITINHYITDVQLKDVKFVSKLAYFILLSFILIEFLTIQNFLNKEILIFFDKYFFNISQYDYNADNYGIHSERIRGFSMEPSFLVPVIFYFTVIFWNESYRYHLSLFIIMLVGMFLSSKLFFFLIIIYSVFIFNKHTELINKKILKNLTITLMVVFLLILMLISSYVIEILSIIPEYEYSYLLRLCSFGNMIYSQHETFGFPNWDIYNNFNEDLESICTQNYAYENYFSEINPFFSSFVRFGSLFGVLPLLILIIFLFKNILLEQNNPLFHYFYINSFIISLFVSTIILLPVIFSYFIIRKIDDCHFS